MSPTPAQASVLSKETLDSPPKSAGVAQFLNAFVSMLVAPTQGFEAALKFQRWTMVIPLLTVILFTILVNVYFYTHVDMEWLATLLTANLTDKQRDLTLESLTAGRLIGVSIVLVTLFTSLIDAGRAAFFWVALKAEGSGQSFGKLFAITCWASVPLILLLPAGILNISLVNGGHIAPNDVNPVSLNQLLFHLPSNEGWGRLFSTFSLVSIWELALIIIGLKTIAALPSRKAVMLGLAPNILAYGLWAGLTFAATAR